MSRIRSLNAISNLSPRTALAIFILGFLAFSHSAAAHEANLTRFGPEVYKFVQGKPTTYSATFRAIDGPAKLVLQDNGVGNALSLIHI